MKDKEFINSVIAKLARDNYSPWYINDKECIDELVPILEHINKLYNSDLNIHHMFVIWEKFSSSLSASFMIPSITLIDSALEAYLESK